MARRASHIGPPSSRLGRRRSGLVLAGLALWALSGATDSLRAAPWLVVTELHFQPPEGEELEFVEVLSRAAPRWDLTGWTLDGEVRYRFPPGSVVLPGEAIVIARAPEKLKERHPGLRRVFGPFEGKLDNRGGEVLIRTPSGGVAASARYGTGRKWPRTSRGLGHTLTLIDPYRDPTSPSSWIASPRIGGTPGEVATRKAKEPSERLVRHGETWRVWTGARPPPDAWRELACDEAGWNEGPGGVGYGDGDDATLVGDMQGRYTSIFLRRRFRASAAAQTKALALLIDFDDGFIAYLNGKEVARSNLGPASSDVPFDATADGSHEAGEPARFDLGPASVWLEEGENVLAIEVHNDDLDSSDLSCIADLELHELPSSSADSWRVALRELGLGPSASDRFVDVLNLSDVAVDLAGCFLTDDPGDLRKAPIQGPLRIEAGAYGTIPLPERGGTPILAAPERLLALVNPDGSGVLDALFATRPTGAPGDAAAPPISAATSWGPLPEESGDVRELPRPTPGRPNDAEAPDAGPGVVINELHYHPPSGDEAEEFVELHNPGATVVDVSGFRLAGAVAYQVPANRSIEPGGFLVLARSPERLCALHGLSLERVLGPYRRTLSNRGEELLLRDARGVIVDRVEYADGRPWPEAADGRGSSLERLHPLLDGRLAASWAASREEEMGAWTRFSYRAEARDFEGQTFQELQLLLLEEGECLIDDVSVASAFEADFETDNDRWQFLGTHSSSEVVRESADVPNRCLRLVATGRGNPRQNYVVARLPGRLRPGGVYSVSLRARWRSGSPLLLSRTPGQGLTRLCRLPVPARAGTPGRANSTASREPPPSIGTPRQAPVAPQRGEPVRFEVDISAIAAVEARLYYRHEETSTWSEAPLALREAAPRRDPASRERDATAPTRLHGATSTWEGGVPGQPDGRVEFYIEARDAEGRAGRFPQGGPLQPALYAVGLPPPGPLATYTILLSDRERQGLWSGPHLSNRLARASLVFGDSRIFHDVGFRPRGSPFTRSRSNWRVVFGAETIDGRRSLTLDGQGGGARNLAERLTYWCVERLQAPNPRQEHVQVRIPGEEDGLYEDVEKVDRAFLARWFARPPAPRPGVRREEPAAGREAGAGGEAGDAREAAPGVEPTPAPPAAPPAISSGAAAPFAPLLHKVDDHWELPALGRQRYREADFSFEGEDPERYRWNFPPRANANTEDFGPLVELIRLLDPGTTPDDEFAGRVEDIIDLDEWVRVLAARAYCNDWDSIGRNRGKNAFLCLPSKGGRWQLLPWDCDLSWQRDPYAPLLSYKFPGIRRLLELPRAERLYHAYLSYLGRLAEDPTELEAALADLRRVVGGFRSGYLEFARERAQVIDGYVSHAAFRVEASLRLARAGGEPDLLRIRGTAPAAALRIRLEGREGAARLVGREGFEADLPIGPEGGALALEALDLGGHVVSRTTLDVPPRPEAPALPPGLTPRAPPPDESSAPAPPRKREAARRAAALPRSGRR